MTGSPLPRSGRAVTPACRHCRASSVSTGPTPHWLRRIVLADLLGGLLLAAMAQGLLAGLGYWAAGVRAAVFWGVATAVVALIPFGAPLIWGSIGLWLLLQGQVSAGIGLLLWGALAVSWVDNLVRPWVISGVAKTPFQLVLFGVLGGLAAFGLIGLFVGPVVLAILLALWREWDNANTEVRAGMPR